MNGEHIRRALKIAEAPAPPPPDFADALFVRLVEEARLGVSPATRAALPRAERAPGGLPLPWGLPRIRLVTLAATGLALVLAVAVLVVPRPQSALAVIQEAEQNYAQVPPFRATVAGSSTAIAEEIEPGAKTAYPHEQVISFGGEAGWRRDVLVDPAAFRGGPGSYAVWDGEHLGEYLAATDEFVLTPDAADARIPRSELSASLQIEQFLARWSTELSRRGAETFIGEACTVLADEAVAGRAARHVNCRETSETHPMDLWIDAEYGLVLGIVTHGPEAAQSEVTSIAFEPHFVSGTFDVAPPTGANVIWAGAGPLPPEFAVQPDEAVDATIPLAARPYSVVVDFGQVWAATGSTEPHPTIFRVDPATGTVVTSFEVGPFRELISGEGALWIGHCRIDPESYELAPVSGLVRDGVPCEGASEAEAEEREGHGPQGTIRAAGEGALWAAAVDGSDASVLRLHPQTGELVTTIELADDHWIGAMTAADGSVWASATSWDAAESGMSVTTLFRVDTGGNEVVAVMELEQPVFDIAVGEAAVWLSTSPYDGGAGELVRIDPLTNEVVATIELAADARQLAITGGHVWVTNREQNSVTRVDEQTNDVATEPIIVGADPADIAAGEGALWIVNFDDGTLVRIDP